MKNTEDLKAYGVIAGRGFNDEFMKIAEAIANESPEEEEADPVAKDNVEGASEPVQELQTNVGETDAVPSKVKAIIQQVQNAKNQSTVGPEKGENVAKTQLAGDPNASTQVSDLPAAKITDAESAGDVEKEASANPRLNIVKQVFGIK